jgi:glycosyltransferase involved in cell wall biosynthesis
MKILLVGEYSRLHNSLKEGLLALGPDVTLIGTGDGYKNYPVDIDISPRFFNKGVLKPFVKFLDKVFGINCIEIETGYRFKKQLPKLANFDVVQLINEQSIGASPKTEIKLLNKLKTQNQRLFLLSCGTDYISVKYSDEKRFTYSILTPLHEDKSLKKAYQFILKYLDPKYKALHEFIYKNGSGVIASDMDYHLPLQEHPKYLGLIPNPINVELLEYTPLTNLELITIFHGVSTANYIKKGNRFFDEALAIVKETYRDKIQIIRTENVPYQTYINHYNSCHILLDQVYAYDQGYNALEAMAKGKVVFTGAEQEWLEHYNLKEDTVAINALPDTDAIVDKLSWLIEHPEMILEISRHARDVIKQEHDYIEVAKKYIDAWEKTPHN